MSNNAALLSATSLRSANEHGCSGLLTDLYELTMAAGYVEHGLDARASFELFVRDLPPRRSYLVVAGLQQALDYLQNIRFTGKEIDFLREHPAFRHVLPRFFDWLAAFRFTGDVWAMPEGTLAFAGEPLVRVMAPIEQAQIVETFLLSTVGFQTTVASKAARVRTAARNRNVIEFGSRRAHGMAAGVMAARAAYIGGCQGTSNVFAGHRFDIPIFGTQAHSWIMAYEEEEEAFRRFLKTFPGHAVLLVDTYDVHTAVEMIIGKNLKPRSIRLDSGDLVKDSRWVRERLDAAGWRDVRIFASGDLDEYRIEELLASGTPIDAFGVGTALATSSDAPSLGVVYKLVEIEHDGQVRIAAKFSPAKTSYPGRKQVFRCVDDKGFFQEDWITLHDEQSRHGEPLLVPVMRGGERADSPAPLAKIRERTQVGLERLPACYLRLDSTDLYPVHHSDNLRKLLAEVGRKLEPANSGSAGQDQ